MEKKTVSGILLTLLLASMLTLAFPHARTHNRDGETVSITYYFSEPRIQGTWLVSDQISNYVSVTVEGLPQYGVAGLPVLPFKTARILLPFGTELQSVKVTEGKKVSLSGSYLVECGQEPVPLSYQGPVEPTPPDETTYNSLYPFPGELYSDVSVQSKMGYRILLVNLHPLQYIPKTGKLFYHESITVEADVGPEGESELLSCRGLPQDRETVKDIVDNPRVIGTYPISEQPPLSEYVIITNEELLFAPEPDNNFQALMDDKISRGISATITATEGIYENYDGIRPDGGEDNQTKIRNFIIDAYNSWGTRYVLLGGDGDGADVGGESGDAIIPHRGFYGWVDGSFPEIDYDIPADMYYACLDGTFDHNANGTYGEPDDGPGGGEVDLFAEVYIGRACVDSQTEVQNFIRKTLDYQATTSDSTDLRKVWMVGEDLGFGGVARWGGNSKDEIKEGSDAHGYTTIGFENSSYASQFDISTLYDRDWPDNNWPKSEIINIINSNIHLLNHLGHADVGYVMKMVNDDVDSLTNEELYFIGYSQGCYCGSFDDRDVYGYYTDYDCISEHLTTQASGAVAFIANSRYGWGVHFSTNGPSQHYDREFWDAVLGEDIFNIGIANQDSKEDTAGWISDGVMRWCYYEINLFGDPELSMKLYEGIMYDSHEISDGVGGDGDGCPEPGEFIEMPVTLRNTHFDTDFTNVTATIYATMLPDIIFYEDFEGIWPGNWIVGDSEPSGGEDYWGDSDYRACAGSWSAYCAGISDVPGQKYDNYMYSYMYRTVDLTGYDIATLSYYYWLDSESGYDYLIVGYYDSADSSWHWPRFYNGHIGDWVFDSLSIPTTATNVGFVFDSDYSFTYEGAYVDEVTLTAYSLGPDPYITITDDYEEYGNIPAGGAATSFDDYDFEIALDCPEDHVVTFNFEITADNGGPWTDSFEVTIASRYSISGQVRDLETGDPIDGATVHYSGPVSGEVSTEPGGNYAITGLVEGTYTKYATAEGYSDSDLVEVTLPPDEENNDFELGISDITVTPLKMEATLLQGETVEKILTINNYGNFKLTFEISVELSGLLRLSSQSFMAEPYHSGDVIEAGWARVVPTLDGVISAGEWDDAEAVDITATGMPNPVTMYVKNNDTHLYMAFADTNDLSLTYYDQIGIYFDEDHDGQWQSPSSDSEGNFWLGDFGGGGIPSDVIFRSLPDFTEYPNPAGVSGALSDAMGYVVHEAAIEFEVSPLDCAPGVTIGLWVYIYDDQAESQDGVWPESAIWDDPSTYGDLALSAWLSVDPASGTVMPGESMDITVTFNATGLDVGEYEADIIIESNDPDEPTVIIPVKLSVRAIIGDVDGDGTVNASDLLDLSKAYGSDPSKPNWNPNCDFNNDDKVEASDLFNLSKNYGKTVP